MSTCAIYGFVVVVVFFVFRGQSEQQSGQFSATIDQSDIRGSKPHNHDPSGAASDCYPIAAAIAEPDGEVRSLGTIPNRMESVRKLIKKLGAVEKLRVCDEAGPTGYVLYWQLAELGVRVRGNRPVAGAGEGRRPSQD